MARSKSSSRSRACAAATNSAATRRRASAATEDPVTEEPVTDGPVTGRPVDRRIGDRGSRHRRFRGRRFRRGRAPGGRGIPPDVGVRVRPGARLRQFECLAHRRHRLFRGRRRARRAVRRSGTARWSGRSVRRRRVQRVRLAHRHDRLRDGRVGVPRQQLHHQPTERAGGQRPHRLVDPESTPGPDGPARSRRGTACVRVPAGRAACTLRPTPRAGPVRPEPAPTLVPTAVPPRCVRPDRRPTTCWSRPISDLGRQVRRIGRERRGLLRHANACAHSPRPPDPGAGQMGPSEQCGHFGRRGRTGQTGQCGQSGDRLVESIRIDQVVVHAQRAEQVGGVRIHRGQDGVGEFAARRGTVLGIGDPARNSGPHAIDAGAGSVCATRSVAAHLQGPVPRQFAVPARPPRPRCVRRAHATRGAPARSARWARVSGSASAEISRPVRASRSTQNLGLYNTLPQYRTPVATSWWCAPRRRPIRRAVRTVPDTGGCAHRGHRVFEVEPDRDRGVVPIRAGVRERLPRAQQRPGPAYLRQLRYQPSGPLHVRRRGDQVGAVHGGSAHIHPSRDQPALVGRPGAGQQLFQTRQRRVVVAAFGAQQRQQVVRRGAVAAAGPANQLASAASPAPARWAHAVNAANIASTQPPQRAGRFAPEAPVRRRHRLHRRRQPTGPATPTRHPVIPAIGPPALTARRPRRCRTPGRFADRRVRFRLRGPGTTSACRYASAASPHRRARAACIPRTAHAAVRPPPAHPAAPFRRRARAGPVVQVAHPRIGHRIERGRQPHGDRRFARVQRRDRQMHPNPSIARHQRDRRAESIRAAVSGAPRSRPNRNSSAPSRNSVSASATRYPS